jgi:phosphatidate phosphatase PAH1
MEITIIQALNKLLPNVEWKITDTDLTTLEILSDSEIAKPTQKQIDDVIKALENEHKLAEEQKATDKTAAQAKLAALGLTADDLKALGL